MLKVQRAAEVYAADPLLSKPNVVAADIHLRLQMENSKLLATLRIFVEVMDVFVFQNERVCGTKMVHQDTRFHRWARNPITI